MLLSHKQTPSRKQPDVLSACWQQSNTLCPCLLQRRQCEEARPHSPSASAQANLSLEHLTFETWIREVLRRGCISRFWCWNKIQFIGFYLKQPSPLLWFHTDCSRERQFWLWMYTAAYAGLPSQPRYVPCWRASRFKYKLCKKTKTN